MTVQLTPSEREALEASAERAGATISEHARELCLRRSAAAQIVAATRRSPPEIRALIAELNAAGNNLNQLAKVANINRAVPEQQEIRGGIDLLKKALLHVLAL